MLHPRLLRLSRGKQACPMCHLMLALRLLSPGKATRVCRYAQGTRLTGPVFTAQLKA